MNFTQLMNKGLFGFPAVHEGKKPDPLFLSAGLTSECVLA
ncbi:hypothetical protein ERICI_02086 [Paenibacillus larvae subsp. larvae]|uniref:Uncharacterized protein n=1 Tax=Paenibacillus larvae subsp. larvae TaxID=147375 RepID=A0A2L1TMP0_9BACL|nr:hypothetical protein ERICI_02086 [Paenibacillus larvae subsp. larvae]AVF26123.1 hypothetical protein ERICIII_01952 [Paenibacillus larvae subsp. larvae]AVF30901.1 hypothetical protein ERICIV_01974 [Paenibacillus larvae subsp. larvae]QHZ52227.1 hypothetical protein ERICV_03113 [Paenibacillus larvae subsp. larvae]